MSDNEKIQDEDVVSGRLADRLGAGTDTCRTVEADSTAARHEIRIEWNIAGSAGGGYWRIETPDHRRTLEETMRAMNLKYGAGTHRIAKRPI